MRSLNEQSLRSDNFRLLSVPRDLAAQPVSVLVQDLEGLNRALMPMLDPPEVFDPSSLLIEPVPKYVIEITLPRIEYVKSAALVVESDELKVIALGSFIESKIAADVDLSAGDRRNR